MPTRFVHTSDWHLGRSYRRRSSAPEGMREARFQAVRKVFELAATEKAEFILVAGDVFDTETPSRSLIDEVVSLLREAPVPTILIAGNHDPLVEGSVWQRSDFADRLAHHDKIILATNEMPIELLGGAVQIFPCPVRGKRLPHDVSGAMPMGSRDGCIRIGLAHGILQEYDGRQHHENFIAKDRAERAGLDYLALGDLHSFTLDDHPAAKLRTRYSGTCEGTAVDELRAGYALLVEIAGPGADPKVTAHRVGRLRPILWDDVFLDDSSSIDRLAQALSGIENPSDVILASKVRGVIGREDFLKLEQTIDQWRGRFLSLELDVDEVFIQPTEDDFADLELSQPEKELLELLKSNGLVAELSADGDALLQYLASDPTIRREALNLFYSLLAGEAIS